MTTNRQDPRLSGDLPQLRLGKGRERRVLSGHPWVFSNELEPGRGGPVEPGGLANLITSRGSYVATVYYNPATLIACRVLTRTGQPIDQRFISSRIHDAVSMRRKIYPELDHLRLVFSESDFLPGLVVDRYAGWLSVQILTAGMDRLRGMVWQALREELQPEGIVFRRDSPYRLLEGLEQGLEVIRGENAPVVVSGENESIVVEISQNGCRFAVDILRGQKTGFFYDQRENRRQLDRMVHQGQSVADICCYTGSWAIKAACLGAGSVLGIDSSASALRMAGENARLNGVADRVEWCRGDALKTARELSANGRRFDMVILDPPPLARSRKGLADAERKYEKLNAAAMRLVSGGGYLLSASCSHLIGRESFRKILAAAARKSGREARIITWGGQAMDHPVLPVAPETEYLHFAAMKIN